MACRQVLAVWPGQTDATYLLGLMAYTYRQPRSRHRPCAAGLRGAARARRLFQRLRRDVPPEGPARRRPSRRRGARSRSAPNSARGMEQSRHRPAGGAEARREPALPRAGAGARAEQRRDAQQSRQYLEAPRPRGGSGKALDARRSGSSPITPRPTAISPICCSTRASTSARRRSARRAIELNPRLADAYINLAAVADRAPQPRRRAAVCSTRCSPSRRCMRARSRREALTLKELDRLDEALEAARRALAAAPESPEPHNALGPSLSGDGPVRAGARGLRPRRRAAGAGAEDAIANRGALFMEFGRKAEALRGHGGGGEEPSPTRRASCSARRTSSASSRAIR